MAQIRKQVHCTCLPLLRDCEWVARMEERGDTALLGEHGLPEGGESQGPTGCRIRTRVSLLRPILLSFFYKIHHLSFFYSNLGIHPDAQASLKLTNSSVA